MMIAAASTRGTRSRRRVIGSALVFAFLAAACSSGDDAGPTTTANPSSTSGSSTTQPAPSTTQPGEGPGPDGSTAVTGRLLGLRLSEGHSSTEAPEAQLP